MNFNELGGFFSTEVHGTSQMLLLIKKKLEKQTNTTRGDHTGGNSASFLHKAIHFTWRVVAGVEGREARCGVGEPAALECCLNPPFDTSTSPRLAPRPRGTLLTSSLGERWALPRGVSSPLRPPPLPAGPLGPRYLVNCRLATLPVGVLSLPTPAPSVLSPLALLEQMHLFSRAPSRPLPPRTPRGSHLPRSRAAADLSSASQPASRRGAPGAPPGTPPPSRARGRSAERVPEPRRRGERSGRGRRPGRADACRAPGSSERRRCHCGCAPQSRARDRRPGTGRSSGRYPGAKEQSRRVRELRRRNAEAD